MFDIWKRPNPSNSTVKEVQNEMQSGMASTSVSTRHSVWEEETTYKETLYDGSYRTDRLHDTWMSPNMSRLPLGSSKFNSSLESSNRLTAPKIRNMHPMLDRLSSKVESSTIIRTSSSENIEEGMNSRYSDFSSTNSSGSKSRLLRSTARKFKNERSGSRKLATREYPVSHELGNNNKPSGSDNLTLHDDQDESIITPMERARPRKSERLAFRNKLKSQQSSALVSVNTIHRQETSPYLSLTSTFVYPNKPQSTVASMIMSSKALQMSSQVYSNVGNSVTTNTNPWMKRISSIWGRSSSNNLSAISSNDNLNFDSTQSHMVQRRPRGWLARHMFGLERDTTEDPNFESRNIDNQFMSSDIEDNYDANISYHKTKSVTNRNKTLVHFNLPDSNSFRSGLLLRRSRLCFYTQSVLNSLRNMSIHFLAFLMAFIYAVGNIFLYTLSCLPRLFHWLFGKLFSGNDDSSAMSLKHHSRLRTDLLRFQNSTGSSSFYVQRNNIWNFCLRLVLPLLILFPLLLILSLLFAPTDLSNNSSLKLFPFFSDSNCTYELSEPRPDSTHIWNLFKWKARCLYVRYFLSSELDEDNSRSDKENDRWQWIPFFSSSKPTDQIIFDAGNLNDVTTNKVIEQLISLSQSVNKRLDVLSQTIKVTDDRLINLKEDSIRKSDMLNLQLIEMRNMFDHHINEWNHFYMKYNQSDNIIRSSERLSDNKDFNSDHNAAFRIESDRLLRLASEAANHSIATQLDELRTKILQDLIKSDLEKNISIQNMSILLNSLRSQLSIRTKETRKELHRLHSQLTINNNRSKKFIDFENNLLQLQNKINLLTLRISDLERLNEESKSTFTYIKDELKKCSRDEEIKKDCHDAAIEQMNFAITNLSQSFSTQIKEIVQETIINELRDSDSVLFTYFRQTVSTLAKESVDKLIYNRHSELVPHSLENKATLAKMIDEALHLFAADRTGLTDYALESSGGSIVGTRCTKTYTEGASLFSIFGLPLARLSNSPRTILQPGNNPGDCWPFHGSKGQAIIRLSSPIIISSVTLEHLPRELAPNGRLDSAPRDFLVKALQTEYDDGVVLGEFTYDVNSRPIQNFPIKASFITYHVRHETYRHVSRISISFNRYLKKILGILK
uniref:SUN domain-containing protein n=2 Tax=Schistosoma mansoni TaxID=6183 RepID=A0A5K4EZF0_SCHMA